MAATDQKLRSSLYVGDLHPDVTEKDLIEVFSSVAPLLSVHVCRDKVSHKSLRYAYVNFWLPCHAFAAMERLNHVLLKGKAIRIMWYETDPIARKNNNGNLFVKNLHKSITSAQLQEMFSKYGTVLSCKVAEENGISKGFGFIQFDSEGSAIEARTALHDALIEGKKLYVSKLVRKNERHGADVSFRSLFVKNLDDDITSDVLKAKFSEQGKVSNAVIIKDADGKSKGFGFVHFDSHEAAKRAMELLNGEKLGSKNIVVAVKKSEVRKNYRPMSGYTNASNGSVGDTKSEELISSYRTVNSAKVVLNGKCIRRHSETFISNKALNSLTAGASPDRMTLNVAMANLKQHEAIKLHKPFYASNSQKPRCNVPYTSAIHPFKPPIPFYPTAACDYFASPYDSLYPIMAETIHGTFKALPTEFAAMNEYKQGRYLEMPLSPVKSSTPKTPGMESSPVKTNTRQVCALPPLALDQNLQQQGSDSRRVLKSPKMAETAH